LKLSIKGNLHGRETSIVDHQGACPSLEENPLMKETAIPNLQEWKLEQHLNFYKYRAYPWDSYVDFVNPI